MKPDHRRTLEQVHTKPAPIDIRWADIESMLRASPVRVAQRAGSWLALVKDGEVMVVRPPHPKPIAVRATVRDMAAFLRAVGITP